MQAPLAELAEITAVLRRLGIRHALIGGWAVIAWGFVRASDDLDLLVELDPGKRKALLQALTKDWNAEWIAGGEDDPIPGLIRCTPGAGGLPIDLLPARGSHDLAALNRAVDVPLGDVTVRVVAPEDLIAMKLQAGGGQDYEDARRLLDLLSAHGDAAAIEARCAERGVTDRLALARKR